MKNNLLLLFTILINYSYSQSIVGEWVFSLNDSSALTQVECPEFLVFNQDGNYEVLNDCYGSDAKKPIIETGKWQLTKDNSKLILTNRYQKSSGGYKIWGSSKSITIDILITEKTLKTKFHSKKRNLGKSELIK